jgi:CDP-glycerol glycerophosphotransferase (TagB/SpsB family)
MDDRAELGITGIVDLAVSAGSHTILATPHGRGRPSLRNRVALAPFTLVNWIVPKKRDKFVLHGIPLSEDGILAVADELFVRGLSPIVLVADHQDATRAPAMFCSPAVFVGKRSIAALWHYLTARYIIVSHSLFGDPRPPPWQCVVNLWHGEPTAKAIGRYIGRSRINATTAPVLSHVGQAYRCTEFGLHPKQVPILGAPRNDRMLTADRADVRKALLGADADVPTLLWLPTYRSVVNGTATWIDAAVRFPGVPYDLADLRRIDDWLYSNSARIVVKRHPLEVDTVNYQLRAITFLEQADLERVNETTYTSLAAFDGLITDASSVWTDYLLLDKPIIFAFPDIDDYRASRGLNVEPYEHLVPGPFVKSADEFIQSLDRLLLNRDEFAEARQLARRRFHRFCDAGSTARLLDEILPGRTRFPERTRP